LGLSISKGIVELMGGKIWFVSEENKGSTFYFTVPYTVSDVPPANIPLTREIFPKLNGKNIIIAEDDYFSFRYLQLLLDGQNANIIRAENGRVLMDMIQKSLPDLILLDINMPVMSGFEFLTEMKAAGINVKIIAQTAYAMPEERERCLSSGCHGYISKPIKKIELFNVINSVLS
jgi:CheY-like chemotaxis protein